MDRAGQTSRAKAIVPAYAYCSIAIFLGLTLSFCMFSEVGHWGVQLPGLLYVAWLPVSVAAIVYFWLQHRRILVASAGLYVVFIAAHYLLTDDNSFSRTFDGDTVSSIIFGLLYGVLNCRLLLSLKKEAIKNMATGEATSQQ